MAVEEKVGHGSLKSAPRLNGAVVIFLDQVEKVTRVVEAGLTWVICLYRCFRWYSLQLVSNVPPFITDEFLSGELPTREGGLSDQENLWRPFQRSIAAVPDPHVGSMIVSVNGDGDGNGGDATQGSKGEAVVGNGEDREGNESGAEEKPIEVAEQVGGGVEAEEESVNGGEGLGRWKKCKSDWLPLK